MNANIVLKETAPAILGRAHLGALTLAQEAGYLTTETVGIVLARAHVNALKIKSKVLKE